MAPYVHRHDFRIVMAEVDMAQIHFTAMYRWIDRGWNEWLAAIGHPFTVLLEEGPGIPIVDSRCRFLARVLLDEELTLRTWVSGVGRTSFRSLHRFTRDGELVVDGELVHVCVDRATRETVPVPGWLREQALSDGELPNEG